MKSFSDIKPLLYIAAGVLLVFLFMNLFVKKEQPASSDKVEALYERLIKAEQEKIETLQEYNRQLDIQLQQEKKTDSLLAIALQNNKPKYEAIEKKYKAAAVTVSQYSDDELLRAVESFR